jgi:hypothetical protein
MGEAGSHAGCSGWSWWWLQSAAQCRVLLFALILAAECLPARQDVSIMFSELMLQQIAVS